MSAVASSISFLCRIQSEILVGLTTMDVGTLTDPSLSVVLTDASQKFKKFGFRVNTTLLPKFISQRKLMSTLESSENFQPTTLLRMCLRPLSSAKNTPIEVLSLSEFLIH